MIFKENVRKTVYFSTEPSVNSKDWCFRCNFVYPPAFATSGSRLIVENTDTFLTANPEIMWIPYEPAGFIFLH